MNDHQLTDFKPKGKWICIGDVVVELQLIYNYFLKIPANRLPILYISTDGSTSVTGDQTVDLDSVNLSTDTIIHLLKAENLFIIFNSSDEKALNFLIKLGEIDNLKSVNMIFINTNEELNSSLQEKISSVNFFSVNSLAHKGKLELLTLIDSFSTAVTENYDKSSILQPDYNVFRNIFNRSKFQLYALSSALNLEDGIEEVISRITNQLINTSSEDLSKIESIYLTISASENISRKQKEHIITKMTKNFGLDLKIYFSISLEPQIEQNYYILLVLTDYNAISYSSCENNDEPGFEEVITQSLIMENSEELEFQNEIPHDELSAVSLDHLFNDLEYFVFNDGGLPLFTSHNLDTNPDACLYTGLFMAIQSMSSDIIGQGPDHLVAGNKKLVFINNDKLRGVAICENGVEIKAKKQLNLSIELVRYLLESGEPEYSLNDKIHEMLTKSHHFLTAPKCNNNRTIGYFAS